MPSKRQEHDGAIITVEGLHKVYAIGTNRVHALRSIDMSVERGEFCAIVGASGSGKSTLLNMLAGLEKPTRGQIIIAGSNIENMSENQLVRYRRENVGFIFQSFNLMPTMTALENVALPLTFQGMGLKERTRRAREMLEMVGLRSHIKHRPLQMSGGQQQRVGIARALVVEPKIVYADEPTGNLDSVTTLEVMKLMQQIVREKQQTLIMVTHDSNVASFARRIFHIRDGSIIRIEDNQAVLGQDAQPLAQDERMKDHAQVV